MYLKFSPKITRNTPKTAYKDVEAPTLTVYWSVKELTIFPPTAPKIKRAKYLEVPICFSI